MTSRPSPLLPLSAACLLLATFALGFAQEAQWDVEVAVSAGADDSEEFLIDSAADPQRWPGGFTYTQSSDLELGSDEEHAPQLVGLRFTEVPIPQGAEIAEAVVEFTANSSHDSALQLVITAEASAEPSPFVQSPEGQGGFDLSRRTLTPTSVTWSPDPWQSGESYRSADISELLREVVAGGEWSSGASLVLLFSEAGDASGSVRSAYSYDRRPEAAPRLLVRLAGAPADRQEPVGSPEGNEAGGAEEDPQARGDEAAADAEEPGAPPEEDSEVGTTDGDDDATDASAAGERDEQRNGAPEGGQEDAEPAEPVEAQDDPEPGDEAARGQDPGEPQGEVLAEPNRSRYPLVARHARGIRGSVLLSDYGRGITVVTVFLDNAATDDHYPAAIVTGDCTNGGRLVVSLEPIAGSRAFSTSLLTLDYEELAGGDFHVNVFRTTEGFTRAAGCAYLGGS